MNVQRFVLFLPVLQFPENRDDFIFRENSFITCTKIIFQLTSLTSLVKCGRLVVKPNQFYENQH